MAGGMMAAVRKSRPPVRHPLTPLRGLRPGMRVRVFAVWMEKTGEQRLPGVPGTVVRVRGDRRKGYVELDARVDVPVVHAEDGLRARWVFVDSRDCSSLRGRA